MESLLLVVTVLSLIVAMATSVVAWRGAREERRRAAARVAALSSAAFRSAAGPLGRPTETVPVAPQRLGTSAEAPCIGQVPSIDPGLELNARGQIATQAVEAIAEAADERPVLGGAGGGPSSDGRQRVLAVVTAVLFVGLAGTIGWMLSQSRSVAASAQVSAPLELLSLTHERQASRLAVSGLVRNPVAAHPLARLSAVVFLFDAGGTLVGSGRAPVDFTVLGAGDESPFLVSVDAPATVARYRVSFRMDDGLVPHVDRRAAPPLSAAAEPVSVAVK